MLNIDWKNTLEQLIMLSKEKKPNRINEIDKIIFDSLIGSMHGLNIRYTDINVVWNDYEKRKLLLNYSITRIKELINTSESCSKNNKKLHRCYVGYGTYGWKYDKKIINTVFEKASIIDTAEGYGFGKVEKELSVLCNETCNKPIIFTKISRNHMSDSSTINTINRWKNLYKNTKIVAQQHFPHNVYKNTLKILSENISDDFIIGVGIGNCSIDMIEYAKRTLLNTGVELSTVQVKFNLMEQNALNLIIPYCQKNGIHVIAYSPLGQNFKVMQSELLKKLSKKYNATSAQIAISWILSFNGVVPIPRTNTMSHLIENFESNKLILEKNDILCLTDYYKNYDKK